MVFSTMLFLWVFLPAVIIGYYLLGLIPANEGTKIRIKNTFLLAASLVFYAWGGPRYLFLMIAVIVLNYVFALLINRYPSYKKTFLITGITCDLLLLGYFKYFNLMIHTLGKITGHGPFDLGEVILPIGISFYIFQSMSYTIDVYRNDAPIQKNILDFALYVSLFPQLIAGPIVQYRDINSQLLSRHESVELFSEGVKRFIYGLSKKVLLANVFGQAVDDIWKKGPDDIGCALAVFAAILYSLQIYYDFSGYSDMAIGLAKMFGFELKENFNHPYTATSVSDFWRRWHISLSSWFKNYVYIPLGGNRAGIARCCLNLLIVFALTGIWHGANYTFFFWGIYYAAFLIIEKLISHFLKKDVKSHLYTLVVVVIGWIFFRADSIGEAFAFIRALFRVSVPSYPILEYLTLKMCVALVAGVILCFPVQRIMKNHIVSSVAKAALMILCILTLAGDTYNPFIYFRF